MLHFTGKRDVTFYGKCICLHGGNGNAALWGVPFHVCNSSCGHGRCVLQHSISGRIARCVKQKDTEGFHSGVNHRAASIKAVENSQVLYYSDAGWPVLCGPVAVFLSGWIMKIYNLGSVNIDHVYRMPHFVAPGETVSCSGVEDFAGGKGYNQSFALRLAGAEVCHIGRIGGDGEELRRRLAGIGVNVDFLTEAGGLCTGHAVIQVDESGQNGIIVCAGANASVTEPYVCTALEGAEPGDWFLTQNETSCAGFAISEAKRRGMRVAVNPAPMNGRVFEWPLELIDMFFVNETEASALAGLGDVDAGRASEVLAGMFPAAVCVVTRGGDGAEVFAGGERYARPAVRVGVVDTTAAGDTFTGYFLAAVSSGAGLDEALGFANAAAALCVTRRGAAPSVPSEEEVRRFMAGGGGMR